MKRILTATTLMFLLASCSNNTATTSQKKKTLDSLLTVQKQLSQTIKTLQDELAKEDTTAPKNEKLVSVQSLHPSMFQHFVEVQGKVDAEQNVAVSPQMPGNINSVLASKGDQVHVGQVLATMDASTILANIDALKKNMELANTLYEKQKVLWDQNIGSEVQYLQVKNQKESLEKQLDILNQQYEMTKIKSPINGTVDEVMAKLGETQAPGYPSFRVVNFSNMKVVAELAENYAGKIKQGDQVTISFPDAGKEITKTISAVSQVIDPGSRSFKVDIRLGAEDKAFYHPNMVAVLKICDYSNASAIAVPVNVVQNSENGKFVFVANNSSDKWTATKQKVEAGMSYGDNIEILSGLKANDNIITMGFQDLSDNQEIEVANNPTASK